MVFKAFKIQLNPNNRQKTLFCKAVGCARWTYNWALTIKKEAFDKKEKIPLSGELSKQLNKLKKTEVRWMYESSKSVPFNSLMDCDEAFQNFFTRCKKKIKGKKGFPKFKSKKDGKQSFRLGGWVKIKQKLIRLPRIGWVRLTEPDYISADCKVLSATVSKRAGKWFVSVNVEAPDLEPTKAKNEVIGVDLGIKNLATCSDGTVFENPRALQKNLKKLKRKSRQVSRKKKGSKNREKAKYKLAKLHYHISNIRKDSLHKATSKIVDENQVIVLEDLKVSEMLKNKNLSRRVSDVGLFEFRKQIEYKAKWSNRKVVFVDRFYPSSKLCSGCGTKNKDFTLKNKIFSCKICGNIMDRDLNASLNLKNTVGSTEIYACGDGSSLLSETTSVSPSVKQEFNIKSRN